ncbi:MAG TPA: OB-fold domain-containing protein [Trebonia sp.]|jgi:uncharacterized OB-fold protein|nr:OB-fold domain-containing protein [Trebonia sp.]
MTENAQARRPLPDLDDPLTAPFWAAAAQRKLVVQKCAECGYLRWPPGPLCPECQAEGAAWTEVRASGSLWSIATYHRALDPAFAGDVPYTVALVELDDGPRMYGRISGDPEKLVLDAPVRAAFTDAAPGVTFVGWTQEAEQ